ncbi:MAG: ribonuclease E inhibitor RraB [Phycisphaerales bacterium]
MSDHPDLPNDADGGAIRAVLEHGSTLDRPMLIDFAVAAPNKKAARQIAKALAKLGYKASCTPDEGAATMDNDLLHLHSALAPRRIGNAG